MAAFGALLADLIDTRFGGRRAFVRAAEAGRDENSASGYLTKVIAGTKPAPLDRIEAWATALGLEGAARQAFLEAAYLTHAPDQVRQVVAELRALVRQFQGMEQQVDLLFHELDRKDATIAELRRRLGEGA